MIDDVLPDLAVLQQEVPALVALVELLTALYRGLDDLIYLGIPDCFT